MSDPHDNADKLPLLRVEEEEALKEALRSAYAPTALSTKLNAFMVEQALTDPVAPADDEEREAAQALSEALAQDLNKVPLLAALKSAEMPQAAEERRLRTLQGGHANAQPPSFAKVVYVSFGVAASVAAVAALSLLFFAPLNDDLATSRGDLAKSRSSAPLFQRRFETSRASARIDKIAEVRARELRANRYRQWGVR